MELSKAIGIRLYNLSVEYGMTFYELSKISGVPKTTIKDIASGKSKSTGILNILRIAECFGMSIREFFDDGVFEELLD